MDPTPRVAFKTIGCRLNQAETARMAAQFTGAGYALCAFGEESELCVIHGCAVTANAEKDCLRAVLQARRLPGQPLVVLTGCPVELNSSRLRNHVPGCLLVPKADKFRIPALLHALDPCRFPPPEPGPGTAIRRHPGTDRAQAHDNGRSAVSAIPRFETTRASIKVQDGCEFGCAYCVVPQTRGRPWSRPHDEILEEIRHVAEAGYREIVLTGANLGCYHDNTWTLPRLIREVETIPGVARIRLSSIEISTAEHDILDLMATSAKLCCFLHLPLQSGSDRILEAMGRRYTGRQYRRLVEQAVVRLPRLGLGTDIIVGFPGEDDNAFAETEQLVQDLPFSNLHVFPYSPRPGTSAATMSGQVPAALKKARIHRLLSLETAKRGAFARHFIGKPVTVLIERVDADGIGRGWTGEYLEARLGGPGLQSNDIIDFTPERVKGATLWGGATSLRSVRPP